ncbi:RNA 3'-terminal phosphate cyclase [Tieghemostelium lacteum]|uniref:RNA 3'-terminal-phosphate cyclase (ATP) n=1 Tax=Tieghemostelium lacteum TaxID=361077 RepID=A0A152A7D7_TIELA|nr:RNA 3'-terminal phosphate cyclase [Tieghemostelium lacteum]|eukprot:KYR02104.1 RNA 3'-terminal phosphate cyclase [Tieghemostelium lacteum]
MGKNKHNNQKIKQSYKKHKEEPTTQSNGGDASKNEKLTWDQVKPDFEIDGSLMEGGGQILRNTVSLATLYQKSIKIEKIRYNRDQPGLKMQHRTGIELLSQLYKADTIGCTHQSTQLYYKPTKEHVDQVEIDADTKTAGSIGLLIQQTLPCLLYSQHETKMVLGGGTNVDFSPHADYIVEVFQPIFTKHFLEGTNAQMDMSIEKRGYYPRGGGCVKLNIKPTQQALKPITLLDKGNVILIQVKAYTSGRVTPLVGQRMTQQARKSLKKEFKKVDIECEEIDCTNRSFGDGCFIFIKAITDTGCIFGGSSIGSIGVPAETVAQNAVDSLVKDLSDGGCVDEYLQDQLIIFMALASGQSKIKTGPISLHTNTSIHFTSLITGCSFQIEKVPKEQEQPGEDTFIITCNGVGFIKSSNNQQTNINENNNVTTTSTTTTTTTTTSTN